MGMQKPPFLQYEKKYLATAMVLFEYCAAFKILMREKTALQVEFLFWLGLAFWLQQQLNVYGWGARAKHRRFSERSFSVVNVFELSEKNRRLVS